MSISQTSKKLIWLREWDWSLRDLILKRADWDIIGNWLISAAYWARHSLISCFVTWHWIRNWPFLRLILMNSTWLSYSSWSWTVSEKLMSLTRLKGKANNPLASHVGTKPSLLEWRLPSQKGLWVNTGKWKSSELDLSSSGNSMERTTSFPASAPLSGDGCAPLLVKANRNLSTQGLVVNFITFMGYQWLPVQLH